MARKASGASLPSFRVSRIRARSGAQASSPSLRRRGHEDAAGGRDRPRRSPPARLHPSSGAAGGDAGAAAWEPKGLSTVRRAALCALLGALSAAPAAAARDAVVFLPGLGETAAGPSSAAGTRLAPLFAGLRAAGYTTIQQPAVAATSTAGGAPGTAADDTVLGNQAALGPNVAAARRFLRGLRRERDIDRAVLVGYSMGGLVARGLASRAPAGGPRVLAVVTLGTPHRGTPAAAACQGALAAPEASFAQTACRSLGLSADAPVLASLTPRATDAFGRANRGGGARFHLVAGVAVRVATAGFAVSPPSDGVVSASSALDAGGTLRGVGSRLRVDAFHTRAALLRWSRGYADPPEVRMSLRRWVREAFAG